MRCRVVNRCFAADAGQPNTLMATLNQDVVMIDPGKAEAALRRAFESMRSRQDAERAAAEFLEKMAKREEDVPRQLQAHQNRRVVHLGGGVGVRPNVGSGRVTMGKDGRLEGIITIKDGDSSTFVAVRAEEPDEPLQSPPSYRQKWGKRW